jgi:hypothetical protein
MFRDAHQRWLVIKTLCGLFGAAHWVDGENESWTPNGAKTFDALREGEPLHLSSSAEFLFALAASLQDQSIAVRYWHGMSLLDSNNQEAVRTLMAVVATDVDRKRVDAWLARYVRCRSSQYHVDR